MLFLYLNFKLLIINYYFVWRCGNIDDSTDNDNEVTIIRDENGNIVSIITANQDVIGYQNTLKVELISDESSQDGTVIDISLIDPSGSFVQPQGDVELCFNPKDGNEDDQCLGFLNEETNEWECEDECLKQDDNGLLCGDTSHFSKFSLLLDVAGSGNSGCSGSSWNGITNYEWLDVLIIVIVILIVVCFSLIIIVIASLFPRFHGKEYVRIKTLRANTSTASVLLSQPVNS